MTYSKSKYFCYKNWSWDELLLHNSTNHFWTQSTFECQERGCVCEGCFYNDFMQKRGLKCQIKKILALLVKLDIKPCKENMEVNDII